MNMQDIQGGCINEIISDMECLNESSTYPVKNILDKSDSFLQSDADHQLLIKVIFRQPVKISGFRLTGVAEESAPSTIRLFTNQPHIGFGEAEDSPSTQDFAVGPQECNLLAAKDVAIPVKFVKFQSVNNLEIFIGENGGDELTKLKHLEIFGCPAEQSDIANWKPVKG